MADILAKRAYRARGLPARVSALAFAILFAAACSQVPGTPRSAGAGSPTVTVAPSASERTRVLSDAAARELDYLGRLSDGTEPGVAVGQDCPQLDGICGDLSFQAAIGKLYDQSGKWPAILHVDYEYVRAYSPAELSAVNQRLVSHWQAGGQVAVSWGPVNPWGPEITTQYAGTDLRALLPGGTRRQQWLASLDRIAGALAELRDGGVAVLWRPMQEMNGSIYWWAKAEGQLDDPHDDYVDLWRDMFDYLTFERGLDNLIWVFAPLGNQAWSSFPYPGDHYVDVVAVTAYSNTLDINGYQDMLAYGKPTAVSEYGPVGWGEDIGADGSFDDRLYIERLARDYPRVAYFVAWNSWADVKMSLADNLHASELMNDPRIVTRDKVNLPCPGSS